MIQPIHENEYYHCGKKKEATRILFQGFHYQ